MVCRESASRFIGGPFVPNEILRQSHGAELHVPSYGDLLYMYASLFFVVGDLEAELESRKYQGVEAPRGEVPEERIASRTRQRQPRVGQKFAQ